MLFEHPDETFLIVGLGNPGTDYAGTRHNCGFEVLSLLSGAFHAPLTRERFHGKIAQVKREGKRIILCQPQTFMNVSGECVGPLLNWYRCPHDHLLVVYDDIDLPVGTLRMRKKGSAGTHNGMRSILNFLPDGDFPRLRVGIGAPPPGFDLADYVLSRPVSNEERACLHASFQQAVLCIEDFIDAGIDHAMQLCNRKPTPQNP